jgi:hypothetical protein
VADQLPGRSSFMIRVLRMTSGAVGLMFAVLVFSLFAGAEEPALSDLNVEWFEKRQRAQNWGRDPFVLPDASSSQTGMLSDGDLHLSAIIYRQGRGVAIINDQILRKGDVVGGKQVAEIKQDHVVLQDASGRHELRVNRFVMGQ